MAWQREVGGLGTDAFIAAAADNGNLTLVGYTTSKGVGAHDEWLVRADAWGQGPCSQSGPCVKLAATACLDDQACTVDSCSPIDCCVHAKATFDDGNPCTTDACDAMAGCKWTPLPDGDAACADGDAACADGDAACAGGGLCAMGYCP